MKLLVAALCQRANIYEHLEAYDNSLQDFCLLLQLQPSHYLVSQDCHAMLCCSLYMLQSCAVAAAQLL